MFRARVSRNLIVLALLWTGPTHPLAADGGNYAGEQFPETRTRLLSEHEVAAMSYAKVRYAINEVYARHGAEFASQPAIQNHFRQFDWYRLRRGVSLEQIESEFSNIERANIELLARYRTEANDGSKRADRSVASAPFVGTWYTTDEGTYPEGFDPGKGPATPRWSIKFNVRRTKNIGPGAASLEVIRTYEFVGPSELAPDIFRSFPRIALTSRATASDLTVRDSTLYISWSVAQFTGCEPSAAYEQARTTFNATPATRETCVRQAESLLCEDLPSGITNEWHRAN